MLYETYVAGHGVQHRNPQDLSKHPDFQSFAKKAQAFQFSIHDSISKEDTNMGVKIGIQLN